MAANGISTLPDKATRALAKIALAQEERQTPGVPGYRPLNYFVDSNAPNLGRPWVDVAPSEDGLGILAEDGTPLATENENLLVTE